MKYILSLVAIAVLFATLNSSTATAQSTGSVTGTVVDGETGETLIGVNVVIQGTIKGASTDIDGRYTIRSVEPGIYNLEVSYISYAKQTITGIEIKAGEVLKVDVSLLPESELLGEITVTAEAVLNNEAGLLRQRQKSIAFSDAISSQFISKSGSGDAAAALTKVTGASVVGGKYVYVRGLGDRYSSIQMNGIELPSTDPDRKTFQLDLIPSSLLDNINTLKTFTPDKPGSFSGGIVDINTKSFPEQLQFSLSTSIGYNTLSSFQDEFLNGEVSGTEWLGYDDGQRDIPEIFNDPDLVIPFTSQAQFSDSLAGIINETSNAFNEDMVPIERSIPLDNSYSISLGNQTSLFGKDLGYIGSLTYSRSYRYYDDGITGRYNLSDTAATNLTANQLYTDRQGTDELNIGGLVNLQYKLSNTQKIGFTFFRTQSGTNQGRSQNGTWDEQFPFIDNDGDGVRDLAFNRNNTVVSYTERSLTNYQLTGEHYFENLLDIKFDWSASYAFTNQEQPDLRFVTSIERERDRQPVDTTYSIENSGFNDPSRIFRDLEEGNYNAVANIEIPFKLFTSQQSKFKTGASYRYVDRDFSERWFFIRPVNSIFASVEGDYDAFFAQEFRGVIDTTELAGGALTRYTFGNVTTDNTLDRNNYVAETEIFGAYGMVELPINDRLKFIGGVRFEDAFLEAISQDTTVRVDLVENPETSTIDTVRTFTGRGSLDNFDVLPSFNLIYALSDNSNLRLALTRTIARPTAREIAPFESFDFIGDFQKRGNPELERTLISNADLRYEIFPRPGEVFAVSVFYKYLENPIELGFQRGTSASNNILQWQNVDVAEILGAEFEVRKNLDFIAEPFPVDVFRFLSVGANLSLVESTIDIPEEEVRRNPDTTQTTRPLQGQSPYIINVNFGYDNIEKGTSLGMYFNVFGRRLSNVGFALNPDIYEQPRPQLDFIGTKSFGRIEVKLSARNLLDPEYRFEYDFADDNQAFQSYRVGRSFILGVTYKL